MVKYYQSPIRSSKALQSIVILVILALIVITIVAFYVPFLAESEIPGIGVIINAVLILTTYIIFGKDLYKSRPPKERRAVFLLSTGFASGFGYAALAAVLIGQRLPYPNYLLLFLAVALAAVLTAVIADEVAKKHGLY